MEHIISKKISSLNQAILDGLAFHDTLQIVELFTRAGIEILEADYGFAWWQTGEKSKHRLIYKSPETPYEPNLPRERGGNFQATKSRSPFFMEKVVSGNYEKKYDVSPYMKSYVIVPIAYKADLYGSIVLCYTRPRAFSDVDRSLAASLGHSTARSIKINSLIKKENEAMQKEAEQEANIKESKTRSEFMSNATHELRTPLAIIKGNVDLVLQSGPSSVSEAKRALRAIDHEVKHLTILISDMALLTTSWDSSREKLAMIETGLRQTVAQAAKRCEGFAAKRGISLKIGSLPDVSVSGNGTYLDRLFVNLIENAILYGRKGGHVRVSGSKKGRWAHIDIADDGVGISEKDLSHVFERFYRSAEARHKNPEGTGLGLAIAKWSTEVHGGKLSVTSTEGEGSTFRISLPILA